VDNSGMGVNILSAVSERNFWKEKNPDAKNFKVFFAAVSMSELGLF
jgi:hypothetical protein